MILSPKIMVREIGNNLQLLKRLPNLSISIVNGYVSVDKTFRKLRDFTVLALPSSWHDFHIGVVFVFVLQSC